MGRDPQLKHLGSHVELTNPYVGTWPVKDVPVKLSESPANSGGIKHRAFPSYSQDNEYVYGELLGITESDQKQAAEAVQWQAPHSCAKCGAWEERQGGLW